jgi:hypothetical protein
MLYVEGSPKLQAAAERVAWSFDWTDKLVGGQTISTATATVTQLDDDSNVSAATLIGGVVVATPLTTITVAHLTATKRYRVDVLATLSGGSLQLASLELRVPY